MHSFLSHNNSETICFINRLGRQKKFTTSPTPRQSQKIVNMTLIFKRFWWWFWSWLTFCTIFGQLVGYFRAVWIDMNFVFCNDVLHKKHLLHRHSEKRQQTFLCSQNKCNCTAIKYIDMKHEKNFIIGQHALRYSPQFFVVVL